MESTAPAVIERLARVRACFAERELDALLVCHLPNVRYLTGFTGSTAWLLLSGSNAIFFTDRRYEHQAEDELPGGAGFDLVVPRNGVLDALTETVDRELGGSRVGFEAGHLSYADWGRLREKAASVAWKPSCDLVETRRAVKDADELAAIEKAADLAARALEETLGCIEPGIREVDVAAEIEYRMRRVGAERPAFDTIVASGPRSALPHAGTSRRRMREGDLLLCDLGAVWKGYRSDLTRTFVMGDPQPRQVEVYEAVLAAQRAACTALREGAAAADVDGAARGCFAESGLEDRFPHSVGHGLGLEIHERPRLHRTNDDRLRSNMVVTVEPGLYFPGWGGVRIEDDVVVTTGEARFLADLPRGDLRSLPS